jgi:hypothetical protein
MVAAGFFSEFQAAGNDELGFDFAVGAAGVAEELDVFAGGTPTVAFGNIAGHGDRRAS